MLFWVFALVGRGQCGNGGRARMSPFFQIETKNPTIQQAYESLDLIQAFQPKKVLTSQCFSCLPLGRKRPTSSRNLRAQRHSEEKKRARQPQSKYHLTPSPKLTTRTTHVHRHPRQAEEETGQALAFFPTPKRSSQSFCFSSTKPRFHPDQPSCPPMCSATHFGT